MFTAMYSEIRGGIDDYGIAKVKTNQIGKI